MHTSNLKVNEDLFVGDDLTVKGKIDGIKKSAISATVSVDATADTNSDIFLGVQPEKTSILNVYLIVSAEFATAGALGDDLDFSLGTTSGGGEIIDQVAICDDGGTSVRIRKGQLLPIINNTVPAAADAFANNGPATSEAVTLAGNGVLQANVVREIHARFTPLANDLSTTGDIQVIVEFLHHV